MRELYDACKKMVLENYNGELNDEMLDLITVSILSFYMYDQNLASEKIPAILGRLDILYGNEKVSEMLLRKYENYPWNNINDCESAMVVRGLESDDLTKDDWTMAISTLKKKRFFDLVVNVTHEFTHLLRYGSTVDTGGEVKIRDGISLSRVNKESNTVKRKHDSIEEGIVSFYTTQFLKNLQEQLIDEDVSFSTSLQAISKHSFKSESHKTYTFHASLIEYLSQDPKFKCLLNDTFYASDETPAVITYFNDVMGDSMAFSSLSRSFDKLLYCINTGNIDEASKVIEGITPTTSKFIGRTVGHLIKNKV